MRRRGSGPNPWSISGPVTVLGGLLLTAGTVMSHLPPTRTPGKIVETVGLFVLLSGIAVMIITLIILILRAQPAGPFPLSLIVFAPFIFAIGVSQAFVFLAAQGNTAARSAHVNSHGWLPQLEAFILTGCLAYALLLRPEIIRRSLPFEQASEQARRVVPAGLAVGAAFATGSYLLALHFFNQPLVRIAAGPLAASIVAVMALLTPLYQFIARTCWRYSLADVLTPTAWWAKWRQIKEEIIDFRSKQELRGLKEELAGGAKNTAESSEYPDQANN
jgi:hypothetical protein